MRKTAMFALALIGLIALGFVAFNKRKAGATPPEQHEADGKTVPVTVLAASTREMVEHIDVTGTLTAANEVTVGSRQPGRVQSIAVKKGDHVKRGQVVVQFEAADQQIALRSAEAALTAAQTRVQQARAMARQQRVAANSGVENARAALLAAQKRLAVVESGARNQEREMARNAVALAQANFDNDERSYTRYTTLHEQGAVSKAQVDGAETRMLVSKQQLENAKQQLALVQEGPRQQDIDAARAAVTQAEAAVRAAEASQDVLTADITQDENLRVAESAVQQAKAGVLLAQQNLSYTRVTSPVDGVVADRLVDLGSVVGGNAPLMRISTNQVLTFEAQVSELQAEKLVDDTGKPRYGLSVEITVDALQGGSADMYRTDKAATIAGSIESVVPVVDARSRNFTVRIVVPRTPRLFPGMFARASIIAGRYPSVVAIPKDALVSRDNGQAVFVAEGDTARTRPVTLGLTVGEFVQVYTGVQVGDRIVIAGQNALKGGEKLAITEKKVAEALKN